LVWGGRRIDGPPGRPRQTPPKKKKGNRGRREMSAGWGEKRKGVTPRPQKKLEKCSSELGSPGRAGEKEGSRR